MKTDFKSGTFYLGDCFEVMKDFQDQSVDMVLADLPYGTTYAKWDSILPLAKLWLEYKRLAKPNVAVVLTANQPFTSQIIMSNIRQFRYEWIWDKVNASNFANSKKQPLKQHESVVVFGVESPRYFPIKIQGKPNHIQGKSKVNKSDTRLINERVADDTSGMKYPKTILNFPKHSSQCGLHPTQKPVDLFEYLIKTYTLENETVLDNTAGSGTTAIAAMNTGRRWICIEKDPEYYAKAIQRVANHEKEMESKLSFE